jgi:hypothetical protein
VLASINALVGLIIESKAGSIHEQGMSEWANLVGQLFINRTTWPCVVVHSRIVKG